MADVGREEHTHEWGKRKCRIESVLTRGGGRTWFFKEGLQCRSDHTVVAVRAKMESTEVKRMETNWGKVTAYPTHASTEYLKKNKEKQKKTAYLGGTPGGRREMRARWGPVQGAKGVMYIVGEGSESVREK